MPLQRLDKFCFNKEDLSQSLIKLQKLNIGFISLNDQLEISPKDSRLVFSVVNFVNAIDKFKKAADSREKSHTASILIKAGLKKARKRGKKIGRPAIPRLVYRKAEKLRAEGLSFRKIGKQLGISEGTIRQWIKKDANKRK